MPKQGPPSKKINLVSSARDDSLNTLFNVEDLVQSELSANPTEETQNGLSAWNQQENYITPRPESTASIPGDSNKLRAGNLYTAKPLFDMASNARHPFNKLDHMTLFMEAFEYVISNLGIGSINQGGVEREILGDHLADVVEAQFAGQKDAIDSDMPTRYEIEVYAESMVDGLLNAKAGQMFTMRLYDPATKRFEEKSFYLLKEEPDRFSGKLFIQPSPDWTNVYLQMLNQQIEDALHANLSVLARQTERGDIKAAVKSAETWRSLAVQYYRQTLDLQRQMKNNLRSIDWVRDVKPKIESLKKELPQYRVLGNSVLDRAERVPHVFENTDIPRLKEILSECLNIYQEIDAIRIDIERFFRSEQNNQAFLPSRDIFFPNILEKIVVPIMQTPVDIFDGAIVDRIVASFCGLSSPLVADLGDIMQSLMAPRMTRSYEPGENDETEMEEIETIFGPVTETDIEEAKAFIIRHVSARPMLLSQLLQLRYDLNGEGGSSEDGEGILKAIAAYVLTSWESNGNGGFICSAAKMEEKFVCGIISGDDFEVCLPGLK